MIPSVIGKERPGSQSQIGAGVGHLAAGLFGSGLQCRELLARDHEEDEGFALGDALPYWSKEGGNRPLECRDEPLGPDGARGDFLAEVECRFEGIKGDRALGPIDGGCERQPNARDDSVGAPSVQDCVHGFALVKNESGLLAP